MKETPKLKLPLLRQGQINKELFLNKCFFILDNIFSIAVKSLEEYTFPPIDLPEGEIILTGINPKESFEKHPFHLAFYKNGWNFIKPCQGMMVWNAAASSFFYFNGKIFKELLNASTESEKTENESINKILNKMDKKISFLEEKIQHLEVLKEKIEIISKFSHVKAIGINTEADDLNNKLSVQSDNTLFTSEKGNVKIFLNKLLPSDTASFIFQTAWQGRAEFGMIGEDKFILKVSPDGTTWREVFEVDLNEGKINFKSDVLKDGKIAF